jgi:mersacidin/lichenicidin family type 2 lantibiotic
MLSIVRAWKDAEYRASLSADELASLPANPIGNLDLELTDAELALIAGGEQERGEEVALAARTLGVVCAIIGTFVLSCIGCADPPPPPAPSVQCPTQPGAGCKDTHPAQNTCNAQANPICPKQGLEANVL